jgi:hypothetical protein
MANQISNDDIDRALLLFPIILKMGAEGARRFITEHSLTDDDLIAQAKIYETDTDRRNQAFRTKLETDSNAAK